jgi:hypothetical protein
VNLEGARDAMVRRLRQLEELVKARLEVDVPGMVAGVRARLESRLHLTALPIDADLSDRPGPLGLGAVRSWAWESPEARKIVLSHVAMRPAIEGFALVIHPSPKRTAPTFGADLMALPARLSVNADVYGTAEETAGVFADLAESFDHLGSGAGPAWARSISSGAGLHAKPSLRLVEPAFAALTTAIGRYLDALGAAPAAGPSEAATQHQFFTAFHAHGPRRGPLGHLMGATWAERYSRLIFE